MNASGGVTVETVERSDDRLGQGGIPSDRVAAQAYSSFSTATVVSVGKQQVVADPIEISLSGPGQGRSRTATRRFAPVHCPSRPW